MTRKIFFKKGTGSQTGKWYIWSLSNTKCDICSKEAEGILFAFGLIYPKKVAMKYLCVECKSNARFFANQIEETTLIITSKIPKKAQPRILTPTNPADMVMTKRMVDCATTYDDGVKIVDKTKYAGRPEYTLDAPDKVTIGKDITKELEYKDNHSLNENEVDKLLTDQKNSKVIEHKKIKQIGEAKE